MERRRFLSTLSKALALACSSASFLMSPLKTCAQDPATIAAVVVAVAKVVTTIVDLMKKSGPGIGDLLSLQAEMMKQISDELVVIQKGVTEILIHIDQLRTLIGNIPKEVVDEINKSTINGVCSLYAQALDVYQEDVEQMTITQARENLKATIKTQLLPPLQLARSSMMSTTFHKPFLIPTICNAAFVETHAMINARERNSVIRQALLYYQSWLKETAIGPDPTTLESAIKEAHSAQTSLTAKYTMDTPFSCYTDRADLRNLYCPGRGDSVYISCNTLKARSNIERIKEESVAGIVREMIRSKYLQVEERPTQVTIDFEYKGSGSPDSRCTANNAPPTDRNARPQPRVCPDDAFAVSCAAKKEELNLQAKKWSTELTMGGLKLVTLRSLKVAADEGLSFLANMLVKYPRARG